MATDGTGNPRPVTLTTDSDPGQIITTGDAMVPAASEPAYPKTSLEWWFVHGSFRGAGTGCRYFMMSIFRYELPNGPDPDCGYYVLLSILDPSTGQNFIISRGEQGVIDQLFTKTSEPRSTNLDRDLLQTFIDETRAWGPPRPVTLERERPEVTLDPFSFHWIDLSFRQEDDGIHLSFMDPERGRRCSIHLVPASSEYTMENIGAFPGSSMTYATRPRLLLSGFAGDDTIHGTAWSDHQWGSSGWFLSRPDGGDLYGWDWVGINGGDGSDWIFLTFHDRKTAAILGQYAFLFRQGENARAFRHFIVRPTRFWVSEKTRIRYSVAMEIEIPEISLRFSLEPVADDQEIPVLGFMRAVWEGAATVTGTIGSIPFSGTARLELHGYGYIFDFRQYLENRTKQIQESIELFLPRTLTDDDYQKFAGLPHWVHDPAACNETIVRPCWDLLSREKKYWRPVFGFLLLETLGIRSEKYRMLLSVVPELTHTATLIIDDIEDDACIRRGDACIHRRYGTDIAINAANSLYFLPSLLYNTHPDLSDKQRLDFHRITLDSFVKGHFGQAQDIYWTKNLTQENAAIWGSDRLQEKILQMYAFKTASAAVATAEAGCILAGSDEKVRDACISYARALGVAFQITDDIQSFEESSAGHGGICGDDLLAGKLTYVIAKALELLEQQDRDRLREILCSQSLRQDPAVLLEGIGLVRKSGSLRICRTEALRMVDEAWLVFSETIPPTEPKIMLRLFSRNLVNHKDEAEP
jgi:geranylgeranyl pyrophosphate synthase